MKKLNNRTKIILAIVGVLVVIGIGVVAFSQVTGEDLFGTVIDLKISPSSVVFRNGESKTLTSGTILSNCSWSIANTAYFSITSSSNKSVVVQAGNLSGGGQEVFTTITEKCGVLGRYKGSATLILSTIY